MRIRWIAGVTGLITVCTLGLVAAQAHKHAADLPAGPIRDRHELMERIGKNAKLIGDATKAGDLAPVAPAAERIRADAANIATLFPPGSTHPQSRAKDDIWNDWAKFEAGAEQLGTAAAALASAAEGAGNAPQAAQALFAACKGCHDEFRKPEEEKE